MDRFWDLLERSVIVQALLTLLFALLICALLLLQRPVPQEVWIAFGAILGFWFGTKSQNEVHAHERKRIEKGQED
jgi:positive regulator of sigma E activity